MCVACAKRDKILPCDQINDRFTCLTSTDSRSGVHAGVEIHGSKCAWCHGGPCTENNENTCEPRNWLEAKGVSEFDTCFDGIILHTNCLLIIIPTKYFNYVPFI